MMTHDHDFTTHEQSQAYVGRDASAPGRRVRQVWHEDILWTVYERLHGDGELTSSRLVFDNGGMIRTCRHFPANWASLPDDELIELSAHW